MEKKFIILHQNGEPIAFNVDQILSFESYCVSLNRSIGYQYSVDEKFEEIILKMNE